ncbi:hypothetical protein ACH5RR_015482 [Cinchona calisaya]|uniref:Uncharacterized protein n=1 Tax=Cinchona calisaya TaxID=153742 RepID=A0ABD2ZYN7_9GENT
MMAQFMKNQESSFKKFENHMGQIARQLAELSQGALLSNIIPNARDPNTRKHTKAIILRSGRELNDKVVGEEARKENDDEIEVKNEAILIIILFMK